jgi:hypothetical protein
MPYVTTAQILGEIPAEWRDAALTDGETGGTPEEVWDQLQASVEDDIAAALSPAYDLPAYDANPTATPILRNVRSAARHLTLATLFRRRSTPEDQNPWAKLASDSIKSLRALGQRQDKGPAGPPRTSGGAIRVIGEPSRLTPTYPTTLRRRRGSIAAELLILLAIGAAVFAGMYTASCHL